MLQITDTHLYADPQGCLLGVNTLDSYQAVLAEIEQRRCRFDAIIATGDLSQDHTATSYRHFVDGIKPWNKPCYWLPGNHDYQPEMDAALATSPLVRCERVELGEDWQMIMLDSQVKGVPHGNLSAGQLDILETALASHPDRYTLVLLHHHPVSAGSAWLDQHQLQNQSAFWDVVERHENVRGVVCGHIHQALDLQRQNIRVMAAPSTCIQFMPDSDDFALDILNPGWRWLDLGADGCIDSGVERLQGSRFQPDLRSAGY